MTFLWKSLRGLGGRDKRVFMALLVVLALNWVLAFSKIVYGYSIESGSMLADGIHSLSDGASLILGMVGILIAAQPADWNHPYGHRKFETFAALAIATGLLVLCVFLFQGAIEGLFDPHEPEVPGASFVVMLGTMLVNFFVALYERKRGRELQSDLLATDSLHAQSDLLCSFSVIVALLGVKAGYLWMDPVGTAIIACFVGWTALRIIKHSANILCDHMVIEEVAIVKHVEKLDSIEGCHQVRTRGRSDDVHVDLSVTVADAMSIRAAHDLADQVEIVIKEKFDGVSDVVVHMEPASLRPTA